MSYNTNTGGHKFMKTFKLLKEDQDAGSIVDIFKDSNMYRYALSLAQDILREDSVLNISDRELIAAYTSFLNNCNYCYESHIEFARQAGANHTEITNLTNLNKEYRLYPLLNYVKKLTKSPSELTIDDVNEVLEHGFSKEQLKAAIAVSSVFNFFNRIVEGHGVVYSTDTIIKSGENIELYGYDGRYRDREKHTR